MAPSPPRRRKPGPIPTSPRTARPPGPGVRRGNEVWESHDEAVGRLRWPARLNGLAAWPASIVEGCSNNRMGRVLDIKPFGSDSSDEKIWIRWNTHRCQNIGVAAQELCERFAVVDIQSAAPDAGLSAPKPPCLQTPRGRLSRWGSWREPKKAPDRIKWKTANGFCRAYFGQVAEDIRSGLVGYSWSPWHQRQSGRRTRA